MSIPIVNLPYLSVSGLTNAIINGSTGLVQEGIARDSTNTYDIVVPASGLHYSLLFNGPGGLDVGTIAPSVIYYLFVIYDQTLTNPTNTLLSRSPIAPVMPSLNGVTYSSFRRIGSVSTDSSSNILLSFCGGYGILGQSNPRYCMYVNEQPLVINGSASTKTLINLSGLVPDVNPLCTFNVYYNANASTNYATMGPFNTASPVSTVRILGATASGTSLNVSRTITICVNNQSAFYQLDSGTSGLISIYLSGYWDVI